MHVMKPNTKVIEVNNAQHGKFLIVPNIPYSILQSDFSSGSHLKEIESINLKKISGIYIRAANETDALMAAIYCYKKYLHDNEDELTSLEHEIFWEDDADLELPDELFEMSEDGSFKLLSFVSGRDFIDAYGNKPDHASFQQSYAFQNGNPFQLGNPIWKQIENPIIMNAHTANLELLKHAIEQQNRFVILYEPLNTFASFPHLRIDASNESELGAAQRAFLFETNFEDIYIPAPPTVYLTKLMKQMLGEKGYQFAENVCLEEVIDHLISYRTPNFESSIDIERLLNKAIRYSTTNTIDDETILRFFQKGNLTVDHSPKESTAQQKLNKLIGIEDVKENLLRLVKRMKFIEKRKQAGYPNIEHHMAAVFMGNPGTAKTTVARIFGQLLFEENVLRNNVFLEVSRKDLIGMYVGWTANKVQEIFQEGAGGTIFIDEAYSLMDGTEKSYSGEAFAAIIQNMENNPDTLVIFAGYTEEMIEFVKNANPGLRSRLTNILEFNDYTETQLIEIFHYHVSKANYVIENSRETNELLKRFIQKVKSYKNIHSGNGRLMRKLLSTSVGYMAIRTPDDMKLLSAQDIQLACDEILKAEQLIFSNSNTKAPIGFR